MQEGSLPYSAHERDRGQDRTVHAVAPPRARRVGISPSRRRLFVAFSFSLLIGSTIPGIAKAQEALLGLGRSDSETDLPTRSIAPASSPGEDAALKKRLSEIFAQVEGLGDVAIEVQSGVVRLSGEVFSGAAHEKAVRIANQLQGVAEVRDEILESRDLERRLRPAASQLRERLLDFVAGLPLLLVSLLVFVLFLMVGRWASGWEAPYRRITRNPFTRDLARQAVRVVFFFSGLVLALQILDATAVVAAIAGIAGLAGLALSFAFRDLAENYIASVLLSLRQPFKADEHVVIGGNEGRIVRLTSRATILMDLDGNHVRIPNADVFKGQILNYSRNPERRLGFEVGVATDANLADALGLGVTALQSMPGILADPPPTGWVAALADWNVTLRFSAWIDQRETDWFKARGEAMRVVKEAFDAERIVMPEPILSVRTLDPGAGALPSSSLSDESEEAVQPDRADVDISRDTQIEVAAAEERAAGGTDLLDDSLPQE